MLHFFLPSRKNRLSLDIMMSYVCWINQISRLHPNYGRFTIKLAAAVIIGSPVETTALPFEQEQTLIEAQPGGRLLMIWVHVCWRAISREQSDFITASFLNQTEESRALSECVLETALKTLRLIQTGCCFVFFLLNTLAALCGPVVQAWGVACQLSFVERNSGLGLSSQRNRRTSAGGS